MGGGRGVFKVGQHWSGGKGVLIGPWGERHRLGDGRHGGGDPAWGRKVFGGAGVGPRRNAGVLSRIFSKSTGEGAGVPKAYHPWGFMGNP